MTCWNLATAAGIPNSLWRPRMEVMEAESCQAGVRLWGRPTLLVSSTAGWERANTEPS